ncbi:MAG: hypothetical protein R6V21_03365 [Pelovirga sp.]
MYLFIRSLRNQFVVCACLVSLGVQVVFPPSIFSADNPNERKAGVFVGTYDVVKDSHSVPFLDQLASNGIPAVYGEILDAAMAEAGQSFQNEAWKGGEIAKQLATQQYMRASLKRVAGAIGNLTAALDFGGKLYSEQYDEAIVSGSLTVLGKFAGSKSGEAVLKSIGITSTVYVTGAVLAFQVWRESSKALAAETKSAQLENFYARIEGMVRDKSRKTLGQGDPFPPSHENIELIWKRVLNDSTFRELFRVYVTEQLGSDKFPEPGFFESVGTYMISPFSSQSASERLEDRTTEELKKEYSSVKGYIAGLVSWLNKAGKVREQQIVAQQELRKLADRIKQSSDISMEQAIEKMDKAITMLGVVEVYLQSCMEKIEKAEKEKDAQSLQLQMRLASGYVKDVIAWIPERGPFAERRNAAFTQLKAAYSRAGGSLKVLIGEIRARLEQPKAPETTETVPEDVPKVDPVALYKTEFGDILKPFDWGGVGDVSAIRERYFKMLETGQFIHSLDKNAGTLPGGRQPIAEEIEKAWSVEDYKGAAGSGVGTPAEEETISGYKKYLLKKISEVKTPAEIISLSATVTARGKEISQIYERGNNLFWGRTEEGERIVGETQEQRAANKQRGEALMEQSRQMGIALKPTRERLEALKTAWTQAQQMANESAERIVVLAQVTRNETSDWMTQTKAFFVNGLNPLYQQYHTFQKKFKGFEDHYTRFENDQLEYYLDVAEKKISENSYAGLLGTKIPESPRMYLGTKSATYPIVSSLNNRVSNLDSQYRNLQTYLQTVETMELLAQQWKELIAEASVDASEINTFIDPSFLNNDEPYSRLKAMFGDMDKTASRHRKKIVSLENKSTRYIQNAQEDAVWLRAAMSSLDRFMDTAKQAGVISEMEALKFYANTDTNMVEDQKTTVSSPYERYLTEKERNSAVSALRSIIDTTNLGAFLKGVAPWLNREFDRYLRELSSLPVVQEENFFVGYVRDEKIRVVFKSNLGQATALSDKLIPGDSSFDEHWSAIRKLIPVAMQYQSSTERFADLSVPGGAPLAEQFVALRQKLIELYHKHITVSEERRRVANEKLANQAIGNWDSLVAPLKKRIETGDQLLAKAAGATAMDRSELESLQKTIESFLTALNSDPLSDFGNAARALRAANMDKNQYARDIAYVHEGINRRLPESLYEALHRIKKKLENFDEDPEAVKRFYDQFKQAYERKNDSRLMSFLDDRWSAGDGTTLYDVEDYFRNMFRVFDEIRLDMRGWRVEALGEGRYQASYELTITGRIYAHNLEHAEKSSVVEELGADASGRIKIIRTPQGRFWHH